MAGVARKETRVLVADDDPATRAGIRLALERAGVTVCAEAADADSAVEAADREQPDVCIVDSAIPGNGIAATAKLTARIPGTFVVVLTESESEDELFDALRAGASGYLGKDIDPAALVRAVRAILRGEAAVPRRLVARLLDEFRGRGRRRISLADQRGVDLTNREWEVLDLLRQALSTAEIARRLFISEATVRSHIAGILHKLGVDDRKAALELLSGR